MLLVGLLIVVSVFLVYQKVQTFDFVNIDDDVYAYRNEHVATGLSGENVVWAFTTTYAGFWHPMTWMSLMLDYELYGMNPGGYHITNVVIHGINAVLLFVLLHLMTGAFWRSALVALLFALHPLHVESVAWISQRKDVLSTLFWMLTMAAYVYYCRHPSLLRYLIVAVMFVIGLMAKTMLVTVPFVLLLLDYWPLNRLSGDRARNNGSVTQSMPGESGGMPPVTAVIMEKIPLIMISGIFSLLSVVAQRSYATMPTLDQYPMLLRTGNAIVSYVRYMVKTIWPGDLAVYYPYPDHWPFLAVAGCLSVLIAISIAAFLAARRYPYVVTGWYWFLGTLVPVIGLFQVGSFSMADRYTYIPLIGLFIILSWGGADLARRYRIPHGAAGAVVVTLVLLGIVARNQVETWQSSVTLFEHALKKTSNSYVAHTNLGLAYVNAGMDDKALMHYKEAIRIKPDNARAYNNIAAVLFRKGKREEAVEYLEKAVVVKPDFVGSYNNLGLIYFGGKQYDVSARYFEKAIEVEPAYAEGYNNLGVAYEAAGKREEAMACFRRALALNPRFQRARENLVSLIKEGGDFTPAAPGETE